MINLLFVFWVILFLYIYFETSAVIEWGKFLKLKFLKYEDYEQSLKIFPDLKYTDFLMMKYDNFFVKLITCQECLCIWINIIIFLIFNSILGGWLLFGANSIMCLIGAALFKFIMKKLYE
jgi:hypothetical protein